MSRQSREPPALPRSYEDYEELGSIFNDAKRSLANRTRNDAPEALKQLYTKTTIMWTPASSPPALPAGASNLGELWGDVREGRDYPPHGNFAQRLEEFRQFVTSEYRQNKRRAELRGEVFVPDGKPDPPPYLN